MKESLYNKEKNKAREEDFPKTENKSKCTYCNFKKYV